MTKPGVRTYFIADISANHDGELDRCYKLIRLAAASGANCAKFQHFSADGIASDYGFQQVGKLSHQAGWKESPYEVFKKYALPFEWTPYLAEMCKMNGIDFMSSPYDWDSVEHLDPYVNAYKIGSGDITFHEHIEHIASKGKPVYIATGASDMVDVDMAMGQLAAVPVCLMQCNTNYTGNDDANLDHINLRVLETYRDHYPTAAVGLSDHTNSMEVVLGAVALGAQAIERHFTDDRTRTGPDHPFSMEPHSWKRMVEQVRRLERALGEPTKFVTPNEAETVVLQRRCLRAARDLDAGTVLTAADVTALRPAPVGSLPPYQIDRLLGHTLERPMKKGEEFYGG